MSRPNWKQITFVGYYMNSQNMLDFIDIAKNSGITHILLEFITLGVGNNWSNGLQHVDTVSNWINDFTDDDISNYLGYLSKAIKENLNNGIVSHSPQSPYLYPYINGNWKNLYYVIEQDFGNYIDWYNIQYYNQGTYSEETQVFTNDNYYSASVYQLQIANNVQGLTHFPPQKIVVGAGTDSGSGLCKNTSNTTGPDWTTLTTWIDNQKNTFNNECFNNGGIMTWIYGINSTMGYNNDLITFWKNSSNLSNSA